MSEEVSIKAYKKSNNYDNRNEWRKRTMEKDMKNLKMYVEVDE